MKQKKSPYCYKCGETNPKRFAPYMPSRCQSCRAAMSRSYYKQHKEERREINRARGKMYRLRRTKSQIARDICYQREYNEQNKEARVAYDKCYQKAHKEERAIASALWRFANKDRLNAHYRTRYKDNKAEILANITAKNLFGTFGIRSLTTEQIQVMGVTRLIRLHLRGIVDNSTAIKIRKGLSDDPPNTIYELFSFSLRRNDAERKTKQITAIEKGDRHTQNRSREASVGCH